MFLWMAAVFHANDAAATQQQAGAAGDDEVGLQMHSEILIVTRPGRPYVEQGKGQQLINFDLLIKNLGTKE
jgi:hypothetical protein